jgi:hypothetical protein
MHCLPYFLVLVFLVLGDLGALWRSTMADETAARRQREDIDEPVEHLRALRSQDTQPPGGIVEFAVQ